DRARPARAPQRDRRREEAEGVAVRFLLAALVLAACTSTHSPRPAAPSPTVREAIERAEAAEARREHDVAREHYQAAVAAARDPASVGFARREFAETLAKWGETEEARTQLEAAVAAVPADPIAWQMLGIIRHQLGDIDGAFA